MLRELATPSTRFFVIATGLLAFLGARMARAGATYPWVLTGALIVAAAGALILAALDARQDNRNVALALARVLAAGVLVAAAVFGLTWLLSQPPA